MDILDKRLIYLKPGLCPDVFQPQDAFREWRIETTHTVEQAMTRMGRDEYPVGVVQFDAGNLALANELVTALHQQKSGLAQWIAVLAADISRQDGVRRLIRENFYDYHTLPISPQRFSHTLGHALGMAILGSEEEVDDVHSDHQMIAESPAMKRLFRDIRKMAVTEAPVLITGESGTGKELSARAIHDRSPLAAGSFVAVNCGAISAGLIQSELFGHEKGAFTGAHGRHVGRFERAHGGTLFLDEVAELPLDMQVNLLRVLQEKVIHRVGGREDIPVEVRVIAATNVDLEEAVAQGRFRQDLYYRLNVLCLHLPPLRERDDDVEVIARVLLERYTREQNKNIAGYTQAALRLLRTYHWPGNVRELINRVRRAVVMCDRRHIGPADLGLDRRLIERVVQTLDIARTEAETKAIRQSLRSAGNNVSVAARLLDVSRPTLYRLMQKYEITPGSKASISDATAPGTQVPPPPPVRERSASTAGYSVGQLGAAGSQPGFGRR